ncbi:MAG: Asp-tRNA(Asn)/Glu-tRNA(Gln) amidotransferase subunit GatA [Clostridia bacterium]|nr:Asp-tRNA(Asn)/Glu-tRNA(Gln) amidotransferase subunit GatA [Clostridia bacterium]
MTERDIINYNVRELAGLLYSREISAAELTGVYAERSERLNGSLNAYISLNTREALRHAEEFDRRENNQGINRMISGIPYAVKDNIAVRGMAMTCASAILGGFVPGYTADVCKRAGDIVLGKTNLDEFAMGSTCERSVFGPTPNPLDKKRISGGSSGGSASAVAAKLAPWALGTDTGGSARLPAAYCGIVALKPTYGLISRYGVTELASSMDTVSPMTENVADNAWILDMLSGKSPADMTSEDSKEYSFPCIGKGVANLKIAAIDCGYPLFDRACTRLEKAGAKITDAGGALDEIFERAIAVYHFINSVESFSNMSRYDGLRYGAKGEGQTYSEMVSSVRDRCLGEEVKRRIVTGAKILSLEPNGGYYKRVLDIRSAISAELGRFMSGYDALFMMTTGKEAPYAGSESDLPEKMYFMDSRTCIANLSGCPEISLPIGGKEGMPVAGSLMGKKFSEPVLYRVAYALEQELSGAISCEVRHFDD